MKERKFTLLSLTVLFALSLWGCGSNLESDGSQSVADTPEEIARATSFVGADRCGGCHETLHTGWKATAHTQKLRNGTLEANYMNDVDSSGRSDFFDTGGLDLGSQTNFSSLGSNAPVLGKNSSGPYIKIGTSTYYIAYTLGGTAVKSKASADSNGDGLILNAEAQWKQRYITKIGKSNYILPVQYNAQTQEYVTYDLSKWYDSSNTPKEPAKNDSYERRCAGCHVTGLEVSLDVDEWVMSFSDISVSCEACHGPGGQHATSPTKDNIKNPATMTADSDLNGDGTVDILDNLLVRNYVCYQCHSRGSGKYTAGGTTLGYSSKADTSGNAALYLPGLDWSEYYDITDDDTQYWGGSPVTTDFIASKSHHQQQQDFAFGPHAPDKSYDHECFVCHDMHSTTNKHMVASKIVEDGIDINTDNDNSTLCLACHAGYGDFVNITPAEVNLADSSGTADSDVNSAVLSHMGKMAVMGSVTYAPKGATGVGRCSKCHMPKTAKSAVSYDIHSHTFEIIWPSLTTKYAGLPNACQSSGCHSSTDTNDGTDQISAWANSGHGDEDGEGWKHYDWDGMDSDPPATNRQSCQRCHTATGAKNYMAAPTTYDAANNEFRLKAGQNQVLYCYACHSGTGTALNAPGAITADYADAEHTYADVNGSNVCMSCHIGRSSGDSIKNSTDDFSDKGFINSHYLTAGGIVFTATGYEFSTLDYSNPSDYAHDQIGMGTDARLAAFEAANGTDGPCIGCHLSTPEPNSHLFLPVTKDTNGVVTAISSAVCDDCHSGTPQVMTAAVLISEEDSFDAAMGVLKTDLATAGYHFAASYPYFFQSADDTSRSNGVSNWGDTSTGKNNMGAAFNYNMLVHDPGAFIHNKVYTKRLIFDSLDWLDNNTLDGTIDLSSDTDAAAYLNSADPVSAVTRP